MPRQQTLRGTLDWSYDLLSEPEKRLFCQLSAFAGGWTLEAAEAVGVCVEGETVLDLLGTLVGKSLVVVEVAQDGSVRYTLLEPVRQYAREQARRSGWCGWKKSTTTSGQRSRGRWSRGKRS